MFQYMCNKQIFFYFESFFLNILLITLYFHLILWTPLDDMASYDMDPNDMDPLVMYSPSKSDIWTPSNNIN